MDPVKLGSGDNEILQTVAVIYENQIQLDGLDVKSPPAYENLQLDDTNKNIENNDVTTQIIDDNEVKLKERVEQCRNIIESLKIELYEEKSKLEKESKIARPCTVETSVKSTASQYVPTANSYIDDVACISNIYSDSVDSKLSCDENLIEYEKQLQRYQNTLNMAQIEKKNAIRKQMLTKAFRLKLLEVENQCNIELLRVKQSLQCLEPLQIIASKWKSSTNDMYDGNSYDLIPMYPELNANSNYDVNIARDALVHKATLEYTDVPKDDCVSSE